MRRTIFSLVAILVLASAGLADGRVEISLWHQMLYAERVVLAELIDDYQAAHPGVKITAIYRETEELRSGYQNSALAWSGPELVFGPSDQIGPFAAMGIIRPLEDLFPEADRERLNPQALTWFNGHLYQVADRLGNHLTLVYNKALVSEPPEDSDTMIALAQAHTLDLDGDGKIDRFGLVWNFTEPYFFIPFLSGFGGWVMDDSFHPTLDSDANRRALQFVMDLRDKHKITPQNCDYETANSLFKEGKAAMLINGDWSWATYKDAGIDVGVARIPRISETGIWPAPMVSPKGYSLNARVKDGKLEPTLEFLRFLLSDESQLLLAKATGMTPTSRVVAQDSMLLANPIMRGSLAQIEVGKPMPVAPELRAVWDAMRPAYQAALGGSITADEAARQMQQVAEQKIREMNEITPPASYIWWLIGGLILLHLYLARKLIKPAREFFRDLRRRPFIYWMVLPAFAVILLTVVYPFIYNIALSLSNMGLRNFSSWQLTGFQNYAQVFREAAFYQVLGKTVVWTVVNVVFHVGIGVFLALLINRTLPGRGIIRTLLILPWAIPQYITALTWRGMFNQEYGAINLIIAKYLHLPIVNWLGSPTEAFLACILTNVWLGFPFMMIVALGGLQSIPRQLYEAAEIDGAGWWTKLTRITLPLLKPVMTPAIVLGMVWTFNNLNVIWLVSNAGEPSDKTHILVSFVYKSAFNLYRYSYAAAMSMVIFAILLVFGVSIIRRTRAAEVVG